MTDPDDGHTDPGETNSDSVDRYTGPGYGCTDPGDSHADPCVGTLILVIEIETLLVAMLSLVFDVQTQSQNSVDTNVGLGDRYSDLDDTYDGIGYGFAEPGDTNTEPGDRYCDPGDG